MERGGKEQVDGGRAAVLFSKPLTYPAQLPLPPAFTLIEREAELSWRFAKRFPAAVSDRLARLFLIYRILRSGRTASLVITGRYGEYFALLRGVTSFFGTRRHILLDIEWYGGRKSRWLNAAAKAVHRAIARGADRIGVYCEAEADNYSAYYGIDKQKFFWMPYCMDPDGGHHGADEGDYIFSGGVQQRDYETLFRAVGELQVPVKVAAPHGAVPTRFLSRNMTLLGRLSPADYFRIMARARLVVLSLVPDVRRCPGVITYVAAMRLGRPVIVNEQEGARSYIEHGRTGILVPPGNPEALRNAVSDLLANDERRRELARNAFRHAAEKFSLASLSRNLEQLRSAAGCGPG